MNNNFTTIYTNKNGYSVLVAKLHDKGTKKIVLGIFIQDKEGCLSEMITINKRSLISKNPFDILLEYEGDFDNDDLSEIWENTKNQYSKLNTINNSSKTPIEIFYPLLCEYVHNSLKVDEIGVSYGYCNIKTTLFDNIVSEYGYSGLEVKKMFKSLGLLKINNNRPYDFSIGNIDGKPIRYTSFEDISIQDVKSIFGGHHDN